MSAEFILSARDSYWWHSPSTLQWHKQSFFFYLLQSVFIKNLLSLSFTPFLHCPTICFCPPHFLQPTSVIYLHHWILVERSVCVSVCTAVSSIWCMDVRSHCYRLLVQYGRLQLLPVTQVNTHRHTHTQCLQPGVLPEDRQFQHTALCWGLGVGESEKEIKWDINK